MQDNIYSLLALFFIFILHILLFSPICSKIEPEEKEKFYDETIP